MRKEFVHSIVFIVWSITNVSGYRIFYMRESGSCRSDSVEINIGSISPNSSGILKSGKKSIYEPGLNCSVYLEPPLSYGLVVSIRNIDLNPPAENFEDCENYLEISPVEHHGSVKLCGYSNDQFEFQSYVNWGSMRISFHTSNNTSQETASFQLTFTAVRNGNGGFCFKDEKRCRNHYCIWKGLTCDGHNNCGDLSDEIDKHISQCAAMTPGESLAVILVTIIGSLILLVIAACLRGPKLTQQIERLSQNSRTSESSTIPVAPSSSSAIPSVNRIRTNYGSTSQFFTSCGFSDMIYSDPPPRYEDIQSTTQSAGNSSQNYTTRFPTDSLQASAATSQVPVLSSFGNSTLNYTARFPRNSLQASAAVSSQSRISVLPHVSRGITEDSLPSTSTAIGNYVDSNPPGSFRN